MTNQWTNIEELMKYLVIFKNKREENDGWRISMSENHVHIVNVFLELDVLF